MWRTAIFWSALAASVATASSANAAYQFQFDPASATINGLGNTTALDLYLVQTSPDTFLTDEGLVTAGAQISFGGVAAVLYDGDIVANSFFDVFFDLQPGYLDLDLITHSGAALLPSSDRVLLATLTFTGLTAGTQDIIAVDVHQDTATGGNDPDTGWPPRPIAVDAGDAQITVSGSVGAVPEPSGLVTLAGLWSCAAMYGWWRRKGRVRWQGGVGP